MGPKREMSTMPTPPKSMADLYVYLLHGVYRQLMDYITYQVT